MAIKNMFKSKSEWKKPWQSNDDFGYLHTCEQAVLKTLHAHDIKDVVAFDKLGDKFEDWDCTELTLAVLPMCAGVDEDGKNTKEKLVARGLEAKEVYVPIDFVAAEETKKADFVTYLPMRNLLIAHVNFLADASIFEKVFEDIKTLAPKTISVDERDMIVMQQKWNETYERRIKSADNDIRTLESDAQLHLQEYVGKMRRASDKRKEIVVLETQKSSADKGLGEELKKLRELPFIKQFRFKDKMLLNIGDIYNTSVIKLGEETKDGIVVAKSERKKIFIGNITFEVSTDHIRVKVTGAKPVDGKYDTPYCDNGIPCFGEISDEVAKCFAQMRLAELARLLYSWAVSYGDGTVHCKLERFYERNKAAGLVE